MPKENENLQAEDRGNARSKQRPDLRKTRGNRAECTRRRLALREERALPLFCTETAMQEDLDIQTL